MNSSADKLYITLSIIYLQILESISETWVRFKTNSLRHSAASLSTVHDLQTRLSFYELQDIKTTSLVSKPK